MKNYIYLSIIFLGAVSTLVSSCSSDCHKITVTRNSTKMSNLAKRDGLTLENAIIIKAKTYGEGIKLENEWLKRHYPEIGSVKTKPIVLEENAELVILEHVTKIVNDKIYSIHSVTLQDGSLGFIHFDVTDFFYKK